MISYFKSIKKKSQLFKQREEIEKLWKISMKTEILTFL